MTKLLLAATALGFAIYCIGGIYGGLRTGGLRALGRSLPFFVRAREPFWFWFAVIFNGFPALCALFLGTVAASRWMDAQ